MTKDLPATKKFTDQQQQFIELYCDPEIKMTLQQIADEIGVSRRTLTNWKNTAGPVQCEITKREKMRLLNLLPTAVDTLEDVMKNGSGTARVKASGYIVQAHGMLLKNADVVLTQQEKPTMTVDEALAKYGIKPLTKTTKPAEKVDFPQLDQPHVSIEEKHGVFK